MDTGQVKAHGGAESVRRQVGACLDLDGSKGRVQQILTRSASEGHSAHASLKRTAPQFDH